MLKDAPTQTEPIFGLNMVARCPEVPDEMLIPRNAWASPEHYDESATKLAESSSATTTRCNPAAPRRNGRLTLRRHAVFRLSVAEKIGAQKEDETRIVQVTIVKSPEQHVSSTLNGIRSSSWGQLPASYTVQRWSGSGSK